MTLYRDSRLAAASIHVDHVRPGARIPLDAAANLVAADRHCNLDKLGTPPVPEHHLRTVGRATAEMTEVGRDRARPDRADPTGRSFAYRTSPSGTALWVAPGIYRVA